MGVLKAKVSGQWVDIGNAPPFPSNFTAYTPSWWTSGSAPALGNGGLFGRYIKWGTLCMLHIWLAFGSTTNGGLGNYAFTLPFQAVNWEQFLHAKLFTTDGSNWNGFGYLQANDTYARPFFPLSPTNSAVGAFNQNSPGTPNIGGYPMGNGMNMHIQGFYETIA